MSKWQRIETAPKDGTPVLLYCPESEHGVVVGFFNSEDPNEFGMPGGPTEKGYWYSTEASSYSVEFMDGRPTHWMPLPPAPESE